MANVIPIDENSPHLESVKRLWRAHSETLGPFPDGAFLDYATNRRIAVALDDEDHCVGYLLFRLTKSRGVIAHFCVSPEVRRQGYTRALMNWFINRSKHTRGMLLTCREDFSDASRTWERFGFHVVRKKPAKTEGKILNVWWHGHGHKDLFSTIDELKEVVAVIDNNIFIDLADSTNDETLALNQDWLQAFLSLCRTCEIEIELERSNSPQERLKQAREYELLEHSAEAFASAEQSLRYLFPSLKTLQQESDYRHVVRALAAGADVLVTRDAGLLGKADEIYKFGLSVMRPGELVSHIDTLQNEKEYRQSYISGTQKIQQERISSVEDSFVLAIKRNDERSSELKHRISSYLAAPQRFQCKMITERGGGILAAYVVDRQDDVDTVPLFRVCRGKRSGTLTRALLSGIVKNALKSGRRAVFLTEHVDANACADIGFVKTEAGRFLKLILCGWRQIDEISLSSILPAWNEPSIAALQGLLPLAKSDAFLASQLEHILWPAKLADSPIPSCIVPINAKFAEHLFDERLAKRTLFGADVDLALNSESAYYRRPKSGVIVKAPGRVLWYVTKKKGIQGTMTIRACSRVVEIQQGTPTELFKEYRRLGVFDWKDVLGVARGDLAEKIMAFRFDDSELLRPMPWDTFQPILKKYGVKTTLNSPAAIPAELFGELYAATFDSSQVC